MNAIDRVLAIDPASTLGWAMLRDGGVTWGANPLCGDFLAKLNAFDEWLRTVIAQTGPALIAVERAGFMPGLDPKLICGGMQRLTELAAKSANIALIKVSPNTWKRVVCANSKARPRIYLPAVRKLGYGVETADEAAAVGVLLAGCKEAGVAIRAPRVEVA